MKDAKTGKLSHTARARLVMGLFFVSALMILLVSVYENIRTNRHTLGNQTKIPLPSLQGTCAGKSP